MFASRFLLLCALLALATGSPLLLADNTEKPEIASVSETSRKISLKDLDGVAHTPLTVPPKDTAALLLFVTPDCPIANAFSPEITRIQRDFGSKKIKIYLVYVDPDLTAESIRKHRKEYGLSALPALLDYKHTAAKAVGATHTPEAALVTAKGKLAYRGRINNLYAKLGKARRKITKHDLRDALEALTTGKPVPTPRTKVIGCYLPTLPKP